MNTLRIQCETCRTWLKVRDAGFVGEVHACPKCGGMVLIAPGQGGPPVGAAPGAAATLALGDTLAESPPPDPEELPLDQGNDPAVEPPASASTPSSSGMLLASGGAVAACAAVIAAWFAGARQAERLLVASASEAPAVAAAPGVTLHADTVKVADGVPAESPEPDVDSAPSPAATPSPEPEPAFDPDPEPSPPDSPIDTPAPRPESTLPLAAEEPPATTEIDPLSFDPGEVELVLRRGAPEASEADGPPPARDVPPSEPSLDARLAEAARRAGVFARRGPSDAATGPATRPAAEALAATLPEADLRGAPLDELLALVAALSGAPATLEPAALRRAGLTATHPVDLSSRGGTLAEALTQALAGVRLVCRAEGPHVVIERRGETVVKLTSHAVGDLFDDRQPEALSRFAVLAGAPARGLRHAEGRLEFTAPMAVHYDFAVLCERLRVARGVPPVTRYPRELLSDRPASDSLRPILERRTTFSFVEPTPLAEVVAYWRRATGVSVLVDWRAVAEAGWGTRTPLTASVLNRPWGEALDGVLGELGLAWAPVDGRTLWITTPEADWPTTVEFYDAAGAGELPPGAMSAIDAPSGRWIVAAPAGVQRAVAERLGLGATGPGE